MSSKKRQYPTAQYQMTQAAAPVGGQPGLQPGVQPGLAPGVGYQGGPQDPNAGMLYGAPGPAATGYAQPMQAADPNAYLNQATAQMAGLNLGGMPNTGYQQPAYQQPLDYQQQQQPQQPQQPQVVAGGPMGGYGQPVAGYGAPGYDVGQPGGGSVVLNGLYQTDLLRCVPPPIGDLSFPPPPLVLAPNTTVIPSNPNANASSDHIRCTLNAVPSSNSLLKKTKLPFALVIRPYISLHDDLKPVPVVEDSTIARCRRCRTYINPFIQFVESGRRWRCNMCSLMNDVPGSFDHDIATKAAANRYDRPELNYGVVEFIAPSDYMARVPQPLAYVFVLDVTIDSVKSGLLATVATTILESLDGIPNKDERAKIAFIAVDSSLHFLSIPEDSEEAECSIVTVPDLEEPFIPMPESLLVNLKNCRSNVEKLLKNIDSYFVNANQPKFALGPALKTAHKLIENVGGKVVAICASLPDLGVGKLIKRDENSFLEKPKEAQALLLANDSFYKSFAIDCNNAQVSIEFFLASSKYQDVASLANLPRFTAGQTHYYPSWTASSIEDVVKLSKELSNVITSDISLEAVVRTRGSSGLRLSNYYGNFFNRASDLCSFPTFPRDQSYVFEVAIEENLMKPYAYFQSAILHSTSFGQRRIRVITVAIPTTSQISDVFASADQLAMTNYYAHKAIEKLYSSTFEDARELLNKQLLEIFSVFKKEVVSGNVSGGSPLLLANNLRMLPLLLHSLTKHMAFRPGKVPSDHRATALNLLGSLPLPQLIKYIYPSVYSLHDMSDEFGLPDEETGEIRLPTAINASFSGLEKYGLYLIDNTTELFLWIGGEAVPDLVNDTFGTPEIFQVPCGKVQLPILDNDFNTRIRNIIAKVRESHDSHIYRNVYVVRGSAPNEPLGANNAASLNSLRQWAASYLIEDRIGKLPSYREFLSYTKEKLPA